MKKLYVLCLTIMFMFVNTCISFAEEISYPAGGLQVKYTYDDGKEIDGFYIDKALETVFPSGYKKISIVDNTVIEGIQVNNSATESPDISWQNEGPSASLIFEYDIMFSDLVKTGSQAVVRFLDSTKTYNTAFAEVHFNGKTKKVETKRKWDGSPVASDTFTEELEDNKWYHIRHTLNVTDSQNRFATNHSVNINGTDAFVNCGTASVNYYKFPTVNSMVIEKSANTDNKECTMYFDNMMVFKTNSNTPKAPANYGKILGAIRDAETVYKNSVAGTEPEEYPPEQYELLANIIEDAKNRFSGDDFTSEKAEELYNTINEFLENYTVNGKPLVIGAPYIKYYKAGGSSEVGSLLLAKEARFFVPVKTSLFAQNEKITLLVVALIGSDDEGDAVIHKIATSDTILYGENVEDEAFVSISLDGLSITEKANLRFRGMVWDEFESANPYLIPAFDTLDK